MPVLHLRLGLVVLLELFVQPFQPSMLAPRLLLELLVVLQELSSHQPIQTSMLAPRLLLRLMVMRELFGNQPFQLFMPVPRLALRLLVLREFFSDQPFQLSTFALLHYRPGSHLRLNGSNTTELIKR